MDKEKVLQLAKLSRIKLSHGEAESLSHEFEVILNYVSEVNKIASTPPAKGEVEGVYNVMREDGYGHESGIYTERILSEAPSRQGNFIKVKKIL